MTVVHVTPMAPRSGLVAEVCTGLTSTSSSAEMLTGVPLGLRKIRIERESLPDRPHASQRSELAPALLAASATVTVLASSRARCRAATALAAAVRTLVISMESRTASGLPSIASNSSDDALNRRQPESRGVSREVRVDLGDEHGPVGAGEPRGLHVESAAGYVRAEDARRDRTRQGRDAGMPPRLRRCIRPWT